MRLDRHLVPSIVVIGALVLGHASAPARADEAGALGASCPPEWPTHCPHSLPVKGDCFARGVSCATLRHCPPEPFARACPAGKQVVCWSQPKNGNYGDCR
jgi:hypothetical protein